MKKLLALAALVLGLASCQTEPEGVDVVMGGEVDATIRVEIPEAETRAMDSAQGIFGTEILSGAPTMRYILEIYHNGELAKERQVLYNDGKTMAFPVRLVPGRAYDFVVWADVVTAEGAGDNHYVTENGLTNITLNGEWNAMDETRDAFTGVMSVAQFSNSSNITFDLTRPFAKLRVRTTDIKDVVKLGITPTTATVVYTTDHRQSFNARTKAYGNADLEKTQEVDYRVVSYEDVTTASTYTLFADYFFADNDIVNFTLEVKDASNNIIGKKLTFNTPINVRRNYLTTISGTLLTDDNNVNVEVKPGFGGETGEEDGKTFAKVDTANELKDAIANGTENITLEGDIDLNDLLTAGTMSTRAGATLPFVIAEGKTLVLDLNGFTITAPYVEGSTTKHFYAFENYGTFTVKDSKGNGQIISRGNNNYGTMTLESGSIVACDGDGGYAVKQCAGGEFIMNGGSISTSLEDDHQVNNGGFDATTLRVEDGAKATINGGTINNICDYTFAIDNHGEVVVNGGEMISVHSTVSTYGTMTINGGSFTCNGLEGVTAHALIAWGGSETTINGGTFDGKDNYNGFNVDAAEGAVVNINGGKFLPVHSGSLYGDGSIVVKGGEFFDNPSEFVVPGYKAEEENGVYIVRKPQALIDFENAIANGDDVTLSEDLTLIDPVVVAEGKEVTINLNGKTLDIYTHKSVGAVLKNNGTLAIEGGTISSLGNNGGSAIANTGTLTVNNATLNGAPNAGGEWPAYTVNNIGTMTLENTTITSKHGSVCSYGEGAVLTLNNCTIDMAGIPGFTSHGIYTYNGGKVIVNGGTYENKATDQNSTGASVINGNVEVNAGTFTGRIENYYGTPVLKGGTYSVNPAAYVAEGYKVIEENGKYNVVPDEVDDVVSSTETLNEAIAAGSDTIVLSAGEYDATQITNIAGKTISFVGNGEDTVFDYSSQGYNSYVSGGNGDFIFENMTITRSTETFAGMAHTNSTVYRNCVINGVYFVYEKNAQFIDCTFNVTGNNYNCWLYGTEKVTYTNCTFNCDGKSIYVDGNGDTGSDVEFNNCTFNDINKVVTDKAAVETGTTYGKRYELVFNNATVNGFNINPNGFVTGTTLWANKHSMPASKLKVTVDGENAYNYVAAADNTQSFNEAITNGATEVTLSAGNYTMPEPDLRGKPLTITGTRDVIIDATAVDARDQFVTGATMVFDGVTINFGNVNYMGFANTASLTYKNCKINGLQFLFGENVTFENCEFDSNGAEHSVWTYGCKNVTFTECDFTYGDRGVNCYSDNDVAGGQTVNFTKCTFSTTNTASEGAVEINSRYITNGIVVNLKDCTAPTYGELAYVSPWDSTNGAKTTIKIE